MGQPSELGSFLGLTIEYPAVNVDRILDTMKLQVMQMLSTRRRSQGPKGSITSLMV